MQEPNIDKKSELRRLQTDMMIMDSDAKKKAREKEMMLAEIKKLKREADMLKVEISTKELAIKKVDADIFGMMNEIRMLKKKINLL